jgi:hypothetical protein
VIRLLTGNVLDAATVSVPSDPAAPAARLADGDRGLRWSADASGARDVLVDAGALVAASAWGIVNHNLVGASVQVATSPDGVTYTAVDTGTLTSADATVRPFAGGAATARYWRVRFPDVGTAAAVGELVLGEPITLPTPQVAPGYQDRVLGNVRRDYSPAGYSWAVKRGASRREFRLGFNALDEATLELLRGAYAACDEGAKKFVYLDHDGVAWWVEWVDEALEATLSAAVYDARLGRAVAAITLREAL